MAPSADPTDDARASKPPASVPVPAPTATAGAASIEPWLDTLFESSPIAIGVVSAFDNRYLRANQALAELYDIPVDEILRSDPFSLAMRLTHPEDLVAEQKLFAELISGARRAYRIEKRLMRADGSYRWGHLTFAGIFDRASEPGQAVGPIRYVVIQIVDTTERRALVDTLHQREEELRHAQKIDGIGRLAAGIAHDFNNLLTVIVGHGQVLERTLQRAPSHSPDTPQARAISESLQAIQAACERAACLTTQLLAHGRRGPVAPRTLALSDAVAALQQLLGRTLGGGVEIDQALDASGSIFADEGHITQVLLNLVLNARDAMPDGGRIRLTTQDVVLEGDAQREWVALAVSDTGHGMSREVQARMFEPFFTTRADRPGTRGTGLGLSTVQRIVNEAGGRVGVESTEGQGTTVTVSFPRVAAASKASEAPHPSARPTRAPNSVHILVVEDEPAVRSLIANVLTGAHYWVVVARDGLEALRFIEAEARPFDLIVADLMMPGMGGLALAEHLHQRGALPLVLFVSGYSDHAPAELMPYGSLLPKPFNAAQLLSSVARTLDDAS